MTLSCNLLATPSPPAQANVTRGLPTRRQPPAAFSLRVEQTVASASVRPRQDAIAEAAFHTKPPDDHFLPTPPVDLCPARLTGH
ncbi:hypothetical protein DPEC_G00182890 [Dallia pectoralis]|uniref:Uncharacterized protein n=1 Tax=Dallia pectoralis TaxID=75939 RepID=A0ACC2GAT1_DALPE|nr:hypothetical protein DPEC_G00182890 [Dallia pectoralis]